MAELPADIQGMQSLADQVAEQADNAPIPTITRTLRITRVVKTEYTWEVPLQVPDNPELQQEIASYIDQEGLPWGEPSNTEVLYCEDTMEFK